MIKRLAEFASTLFYCGYSPVAPGTIGSLVALLLISPLIWMPSIFCCFILFLVTTVAGFALIPYYLQGSTDDLQEIVIDEASGLYLSIFIAMLVAKLGVVKVNWLLTFAICFVLFRVFDIAKPWVVGYCDRNIKGTAGIMLDDIAAGALAGGIMGMLLITYKYLFYEFL